MSYRLPTVLVGEPISPEQFVTGPGLIFVTHHREIDPLDYIGWIADWASWPFPTWRVTQRPFDRERDG